MALGTLLPFESVINNIAQTCEIWYKKMPRFCKTQHIVCQI